MEGSQNADKKKKMPMPRSERGHVAVCSDIYHYSDLKKVLGAVSGRVRSVRSFTMHCVLCKKSSIATWVLWSCGRANMFLKQAREGRLSVL